MSIFDAMKKRKEQINEPVCGLMLIPCETAIAIYKTLGCPLVVTDGRKVNEDKPC